MSTPTQGNPSTSEEQHGSIMINGEKYPLPEPVVKNIEKVIGLRANQERSVPVHERVLAKVAEAFGRPQFLYAQMTLFTSWWVYSRFAEAGLVDWDLPLLSLQNQGIDVASLLIATGVLVRQTRQDKISEQRSHLMLQINLLNEQKVAKVIKLIEELRTDLPNVKDRYDWESDAMQKSTDPQVVLNILQENLEHMSDPDQSVPDSDAETAHSE